MFTAVFVLALLAAATGCDASCATCLDGTDQTCVTCASGLVFVQVGTLLATGEAYGQCIVPSTTPTASPSLSASVSLSVTPSASPSTVCNRGCRRGCNKPANGEPVTSLQCIGSATTRCNTGFRPLAGAVGCEVEALVQTTLNVCVEMLKTTQPADLVRGATEDSDIKSTVQGKMMELLLNSRINTALLTVVFNNVTSSVGCASPHRDTTKHLRDGVQSYNVAFQYNITTDARTAAKVRAE